MAENSDHFRLSPELFERSAVSRVPKKRSLFFRYRLRIFCALHRPVTFISRIYHCVITILILFSCITVNVFDDLFKENVVRLMAITDTLLVCILTAELILRLWSSECIHDFKGFKGKLQYFKKYGVQRGLDLLGILTFTVFVFFQRIYTFYGTILRLLHVVQVFQIYRLILPLLKLMISTIMVQSKQLYIAFLFASIIFVLMSFSIYLTELQSSFGVDPNNNVSDSQTMSLGQTFYFTYISLTTIGYGDLVPSSVLGKTVVMMFAIIGVSAFQLPAAIFGTGLAIKLKDEQKKLLFQYPAANMLQRFWKCYATDIDSKLTAIWKTFERRRTYYLTETDKQCIRFILKFRYFRARRQFKTVTDPKRFSDDSELQLELLRKVTLIENIVIELKDRTYELKTEYDSVLNQIQLIVQNLE